MTASKQLLSSGGKSRSTQSADQPKVQDKVVEVLHKVPICKSQTTQNQPSNGHKLTDMGCWKMKLVLSSVPTWGPKKKRPPKKSTSIIR